VIRRKPTHPGEILLEDVIKPLGLTITETAQKLGVCRKTLSDLVHQKSSLSPGKAPPAILMLFLHGKVVAFSFEFFLVSPVFTLVRADADIVG